MLASLRLIIFEGFSLKTNQDEVEIGLIDIILFCQKYWKSLLALPLLGILLAMLLMRCLPERYQASVVMLMIPAANVPPGNIPPVNNGAASPALIASVLQGEEVLGRVVKQLRPAKDIGAVTAAVGKDGGIEIKAESHDAAMAVALANTVARVGRELVLEQGLTPYSRQWSQMRGQLLTIQSELGHSQSQMAKLVPGGVAALDESIRLQLQAMAWRDVQFVYVQGDGVPTPSAELPLAQKDNALNMPAKRFTPEQWQVLRNYYFYTVMIDVLQKRIMLIRPQVERDMQIGALANAAQPSGSAKKAQYLMMGLAGGLIMAVLLGLARELWQSIQTELRHRLKRQA